MSRTIITNDGFILYRTTLMPWARAAAFAKCIATNARFTDVELLPSAKAKGDQYYIIFRPTNTERQLDMYQAEYDKRAQRAEEEGGDYIFFDCPDTPRKSVVFNPASGKVYEMLGGHCSCPDKQYRCSAASLHCKHEIERSRRKDNGTYPYADKVTPVSPITGQQETPEQRRARIMKNIERDF
jgi:hypothetical protein